ncbi:uncharacterized protein FOMMEDRAFT_111992 [Fomitiporia mediterranea MF3/22]|uniref:uncharacterized protein n=1 Tax=Fomitiporia mediterranea (strain MF3/22) TaxID=694068 RepID=UPI0004409B55|nr:uncharacterized protein FOMMEDRAFT_111992 [Fomitiporia mediterranea MF3/22]EJD00434.1 hypothetical protein FOMMEDRAFT_111992 [Fomitiporia mediterranea MF3/22]
MNDHSGPLSPPLTASTRNFRESIHLIPSLQREKRPKSYEPPQLKLWVVLPAALLMVALGIGLEVALFFSQKNSGYSVKEKNIFKFASTQFLTSFFPILLVAPLGLLWESKNWLVKRYQPYINLSKGDASAEDSLLLDYVSINTLYCVFLAFYKRHWLVFISAVAGLATLLLQPLAGSIFDVQQFPEPNSGTVQSIRSLGLDPDRFQLTAFLAAAGYVLAAVSNNLLDPPFIHNNWATADFTFPDGNYLNGTVTTNTTGVRTNATCSAPSSISLGVSDAVNYTITASSNSIADTGCGTTVSFNPASSTQQYGVQGVANCGPHANMNQTFWPVFYWFYHNNSAGNPQAAGVFCAPTLEVFNVWANASLNDGSLGNVTIISPIGDMSNNNVTGVPQMGVPFNGVIFDPNTDPFIAARANATTSGVPGAILRAVTTNQSLSNTAFNSPDGFVEPTSRIYTQHLALIAKNTYFLQANDTLPATIFSLKPRLVIEPLSAHALSVLLIIVGLLMFFIGVWHRKIRRGVFLGAPPGSIASAVALTSRSGFGELLVPYDDELGIATKLTPYRFRLDYRTGAIMATDAPGYQFAKETYRDNEDNEKPGILSRGSSAKAESSTGNEETRMSLLDHRRDSSIAPLTQAGYEVEPFSPPSRSPDPEGHA